MNLMNQYLVSRADPSSHQWQTMPLPSISGGEVLLSIDLFSFTANNVTYAMFGDKMKYWEFFPTNDLTLGCIPVWGFATVESSAVEGIAVGERFYGYFPMASHLVVRPERATAHGFTDGAVHRRELPAIYNQYVRCSNDSMYRADREAEIALLRPLFITSFLLEDFLADEKYVGATQVLLSSASSKTAYGTAACLARRGGVDVIGLTSPGNVEFVKSLGCYSKVVTYDALKTLDPKVATVYCDFAGNASLRATLHTHFGDALKYSCSIGGTHWEDLGGTKDLPGPRPTLFFAPAQGKKRVTEWGAAVFQARATEAWEHFMQQVTQSTPRWMNVVQSTGSADVERVVRAVINGEVQARDGHVLRFG
ncbi:MAG: DUF2855 family protein [Betaproteobacteria bacterium]|nr:MAG: DUF2855 family protein [Betaproteobacteria bacterium]